MKRLTVLETGETFNLDKLSYVEENGTISIQPEKDILEFKEGEYVIDDIPVLNINDINLQHMSPAFKERLQGIIEDEILAINCRDFIRKLFPTATEVNYTIDVDHGNERVYMDFGIIKDKDGNELVTGDNVYDYIGLDDTVREFTNYVSFDEVMESDGFTINLDTFKIETY